MDEMLCFELWAAVCGSLTEELHFGWMDAGWLHIYCYMKVCLMKKEKVLSHTRIMLSGFIYIALRYSRTKYAWSWCTCIC